MIIMLIRIKNSWVFGYGIRNKVIGVVIIIRVVLIVLCDIYGLCLFFCSVLNRVCIRVEFNVSSDVSCVFLGVLVRLMIYLFMG